MVGTMTVREFRNSTAQAWEVLRRDGEVVITSNGKVFGRLVPPRPDQVVDQVADQGQWPPVAGEPEAAIGQSRITRLVGAGHEEIARREAEFWDKLAHADRYHPDNLKRAELTDNDWTAFWDVVSGE